MFKDLPEGQTHSYNDGCGDPAHNMNIKGCPHLSCLVYHKDGVCNCDMARYCPECKGAYANIPITSDGIKDNMNIKNWESDFCSMLDDNAIGYGHYASRKNCISFIHTLLEEQKKEIFNEIRHEETKLLDGFSHDVKNCKYCRQEIIQKAKELGV